MLGLLDFATEEGQRVPKTIADNTAVYATAVAIGAPLLRGSSRGLGWFMLNG